MQKHDKGRLIVISGPSGTGKGTVISRLMELRDDLCLSVSVTTRPPRPGEIDGKDYFFLTREEFSERVEAGGLLEHAEFVGNCYGTPKDFVERKIDEGVSVILESTCRSGPGRQSLRRRRFGVHSPAVRHGA